MGTHYFYIIWLPLRKWQYAVVLQWLVCGQGQGLKAMVKATTPRPRPRPRPNITGSAWVSYVLLDSLPVNERTDRRDFHYILCYCKNASHSSLFLNIKVFQYFKYFYGIKTIKGILNTFKKYFAQHWQPDMTWNKARNQYSIGTATYYLCHCRPTVRTYEYFPALAFIVSTT